MKSKNYIREIQLPLLVAIGILLLASCRNETDDSVGNTPQSAVELVPLLSPYRDVQEPTSRADGMLPEGYLSYDELYPTTMPPNKTIGIFLTPDRSTSLGTFIYEGKVDGISNWKSTITVEQGKQYYIYGFMPREDADGASITSIGGNYANGAVLEIERYKTLTTADASVVVGVRNATAAEKISGPLSPIKLGAFSYLGMEEGDNRIFVLLKHIFAAVHVKAFIGPKYHKLRSIKITGVDLVAYNIPATVDITIRLEANDEGNDPVTETIYAPSVTQTTRTATLFPYEGVTEYDIPEKASDPNPEGFLACFMPIIPDPSQPLTFALRTTYNVYDSKGTLIREGCVAENKIDHTKVPGLDAIKAGDLFTVNLEVEPDYLYVLSDPDLDNPTIQLTTTP